MAQRRPGAWGAIAGIVAPRHREVRALDGASFSIARGELVGLIGPNGAGKSTTVKLLSGILVPDEGACVVDGLVPWERRSEHVRRIGVVFGQRTQLWWDLPVADTFDLLRDVYRVDRVEHARALDELVPLLGLAPLLDVPARQLSLGQRMRCDLAASLLHAPSLLFLDEPTIGLDAASKLAVRDLVRRLNRERGVTVILTSNDMDDVEQLCERVLVLASGRVLLDGDLEVLRARVGSRRRLVVELLDEHADVRDPDADLVARDGARITLAFDPARVPPATLIARITSAHAVRDLLVLDPPIEEIVATLCAEPHA